MNETLIDYKALYVAVVIVALVYLLQRAERVKRERRERLTEAFAVLVDELVPS